MVAPSQARLFTGLALFLLGAGFYAVLIAMIVARWLFLALRLEQMQPSDWINMGAAAIAMLARVRLLSAMGSDPLLGQVREALYAATILLWTVASWWIPLLAGLTLWRAAAAVCGQVTGSTVGRWCFRLACTRRRAGGWRMTPACRRSPQCPTPLSGWRWQHGP